MIDKLQAQIREACQDLFKEVPEVVLTRPEEQFGDYATNVALQLAKPLGKNPREVAENIAEKLRSQKSEHISEITVAGPGFINLKLTDEALLDLFQQEPTKSLDSKVVVTEYSDPNPFKILHAGHVYTTVVGDAIANLIGQAGATVHRVNYGGDVGLHVGKTMWAIIKKLGGEYPEKLHDVPDNERAAWLSAQYVEGNNAYENDEHTKADIVAFNKQVYKLHSDNDHDSAFAHIYWIARKWSYEAFDQFYARLGTNMEKYYPESEVAQTGLEKVRENIGKVFVESEGAVVFKGEDYGLHTRVFITSQGLPTYEAKEVGLIIKKYNDYHFDRSVVITANEQQEYMAVALKAIEQFLPDLARASQYVPHGMVKLVGGIKMSSRHGNIIPATEVLDVTAAANKKIHGKDDDHTVLGAIKYAFLKQRIGGDTIYDPEESVSLEGNSGPYLQYAHARARSILGKAPQVVSKQLSITSLEVEERSLARKIGEYAEVVDKAVAELAPHLICTYLYELAQTFNRFYENNRVIGDHRQETRLNLVQSYANTLKSGLELLNINAPEKM